MTALAGVLVAAMSIGSLPNADVEREARAIEAMLIAPCCFSQQVSVHQSAAAQEVRRDVRTRLAAGQTRQEILDAYVARYGKRILAAPPAAGFDLTLYLMPIAIFLASAVLMALMLGRFAARRAAEASPPFDEEMQRRLDDELRELD